MTVMPRDSGQWTVDDLEQLPDDGLRYELVDGTLLVSPSPSRLHQRAVGKLYLALQESCPADLEVLFSPTDYQPTSTRSLQPDVLVCARADPGMKALTWPLALAVEVLSPSSRSVDRLLKRELYEQAGVGGYWVIDGETARMTVWERDGQGFGSPRELSGAVHLDRPYPVRLRLDQLAD